MDGELYEALTGTTMRSIDRKGKEWYWEDHDLGVKSITFDSYEEAQEDLNSHLEQKRGRPFKKYKFRRYPYT